MRGRGLPGCGRGVTVPSSMWLNPSAPERFEMIAVLVEAGGQAQRMRETQPAQETASVAGNCGRGPERPHPLQSGEAQIVRRLG